MKLRRKMLMLLCLVPGLSFLQSCSLEDQLFFAWAFLIQERWKDGQNYLVFNTWIPAHLGLGCGVISIDGQLPVGLRHPPKFLRWTLKTFESGSGETQQSFVTPVADDGSFDGSFDTPGSNLLKGGGMCVPWEFHGNTSVDIDVSPRGGFVPDGAKVSGQVNKRPIEKLKRCTPKILKTNKGVPNLSSFVGKTPGKSTQKIVATSGSKGVEVHCHKTKPGAQGQIKVTHTNKKIERILFQCD